jgi:pimeloyl-ACP methyl ester carboxylesterase
MDRPDTRYAQVGEADVAYRVVGGGPIDLLFVYGLGSHVDLIWQLPRAADWLNRMASFSRLIFLDRRGTGASDGIVRSAIPTWEDLTDDIGAVLSAVGSTHTAVMASLEAGPTAILYATMHPDQVRALVLLNTTARYCEAEDYEIGAKTEVIDAIVKMLARHWGTEAFISRTNPSRADDPDGNRIAAIMGRASATPRSAAAQYDYYLRNLDVRAALPLVQAPTLVLHVKDSPLMPLAFGRYLAEHIPGAMFVELPGADLGTPSEDAVRRSQSS